MSFGLGAGRSTRRRMIRHTVQLVASSDFDRVVANQNFDHCYRSAKKEMISRCREVRIARLRPVDVESGEKTGPALTSPTKGKKGRKCKRTFWRHLLRRIDAQQRALSPFNFTVDPSTVTQYFVCYCMKDGSTIFGGAPLRLSLPHGESKFSKVIEEEVEDYSEPLSTLWNP